jgi:predicted O-methyltransferase YrrM/Tfp pilus assembly protein PilF
MEKLSELQQQAAKYFAQQNYSEAVVLFERMIQANPTLMSNYWYLGLAFLLQGEEAEAQATWISAWVQAESEQIEVKTTELIDILEAEAQRQESQSHFLSAWIIRQYIHEFAPQYINNLLAIVLLPTPLGLDCFSAKKLALSQATQFLFKENYDSVFSLCLQVLALVKPFEEVYDNFFIKCFELTTPNKKNQEWLDIENKFAQAYYQTGILLLKQKRLQESVDAFQKSIKIIPEFSDLHFYKGIALSKQRQYEEAISSLQKAIELNSAHNSAYQKLSQIESHFNRIKSKNYHFIYDLFTDNIPILEKYLSGFLNTEIQALEIGSFTGESACWLLENVLTHQLAKLTCIDPFSSAYEKFFDYNIKCSQSAEKVQKIKGISQEVLRKLPIESYDIIYVDGSHLASDVLEDAVLSWRLLKPGGLIVFDDYYLVYLDASSYSYEEAVMHGFLSNPNSNPKVGIDAFLVAFEDKIKILHKGNQVIIEKLAAQING